MVDLNQRGAGVHALSAHGAATVAQCQADAVLDRATFGIALQALLAFLFKFRIRDGEVKHFASRNDVLGEGLPSDALVVLPEHIELTDLDGRHTKMPGNFIHQRLIGINDLRRPKAAHRRRVAVVGVDAGGINAHVGNVVGSCCLNHGTPGYKGR